MTKTKGKRSPPTKKALEAMIEEATVDSYDDSEQLMGFHTMLTEHLELPFGTVVLGLPVTVSSLTDDGRDIVAVCRRGSQSQRIRLVDLPLPKPPPPGSQWIEAYRCWARRR